MDLFCRITLPYDELEGFLVKFSSECDKLIVYQHDGTRTHIHFYAVNCRIKTDAIKCRIKKHLQVTEFPKSNWSFKSADDSKCITYMSKGILTPRYVKGFTDEEVLGYTQAWVEKPVLSVVDKKSTLTQYDMSMEVYELVKEWASQKFGLIHTHEIYKQCVVTAISVCHKHRKGFDEFSIRKIVQPAYTKFEHCQTQFVEKVVDKFFS